MFALHGMIAESIILVLGLVFVRFNLSTLNSVSLRNCLYVILVLCAQFFFLCMTGGGVYNNADNLAFMLMISSYSLPSFLSYTAVCDWWLWCRMVVVRV